MAVVTALASVYTAWATKDTMLGVVVGLGKAVLALAVGFGLNLSPEQTAATIALITMGAGFFNRTQTYPLGDPPPPQQLAIAAPTASDIKTT
jgi:hypothetical protein